MRKGRGGPRPKQRPDDKRGGGGRRLRLTGHRISKAAALALTILSWERHGRPTTPAEEDGVLSALVVEEQARRSTELAALPQRNDKMFATLNAAIVALDADEVEFCFARQVVRTPDGELLFRNKDFAASQATYANEADYAAHRPCTVLCEENAYRVQTNTGYKTVSPRFAPDGLSVAGYEVW